MATSILKTAKTAVQYWWISLLSGIFFVIVGFWVFKTPLESYLALSILFSVAFFVSGVFEILYAVSNRSHLEGWGWALTGGIIDLILGFILMSNPGITIAVLPLFVGFAVLFRSVMAMGAAFDLKSYGSKDWGWMLLIAILGILFSFMLLWNPIFAGATIIIWTGLAFISIGIFRIMLSLRLRKLHKLTTL